jgi:hypothetical protein
MRISIDSSKARQSRTVLGGILSIFISFISQEERLLFLNWILKRPLTSLNTLLFWICCLLRASPNWLRWIKDLLSTATSSVLLNGTAGKDFMCKRGVIQGDPLCPLLFAVAADLLQCVINREYRLGNLLPPLSSKA